MNKNSMETIRPLSVGNVVSSGMTLYRSNLSRYFGVAVKAILWLIPGVLSFIIPIMMGSSGNNFFIVAIAGIISFIVLLFCAGRSMASQALISRLAYQEIINQPESVPESEKKVYPKTWNFVGMTVSITLRILGIYILMCMMLVLSLTVFASQGKFGEATFIILAAFIIAIFSIIYLISRWFVSEVVLAVEDGVNGGSSMQRSWDLSKGSVGRLQSIVFVAFLVTLPVQTITGGIPSLFVGSPSPGSTSFFVAQFFSLIFSLIGSLIVIPFWQAIKAVIYYDLRSRIEGIDLQLRSNLR